ncbi:hypothetical protein [Anaerotignum sp. MB30-C6]|uniref:hypothetical protein n=1 Tax=Anaerotignum sp. MB30-C6 TaxID=3070814 RepID=UPI0027DCF2D7|nr:hypothetical protein [Anaerotignum sp. MB30-C6]WMI81801.1 hypothetical protein RBQ60_03480 [Anaerotignum sp. MB30-C6]WMI81900.1 hypothetical protein RBQ60_03995 [Anaerotignum sp. MB30-C6]
MDRQSRKLLKHISNKQNNPEGFMFLVELFDQYEKLNSLSEQQIMAMLRYLESEGYIHCLKSVHSGDPIGFELEHKGHHQKAFKFDDFKKYLIHNWIAIAALTISVASIAMQL